MINHSEISAGLNTLELLREEIVKFAEDNQYLFSENDIRYYFPNQLNRVLMFNTLNLSYFERVIRNKTELDRTFLTPPNHDHFFVMTNYISMTRINLVIGICIVLEGYIRKICEVLDIGKQGENIRNLRGKVFDRVNISKDGNLWKAQSILFNVRNTIHNNSKHTGADCSIEYRNRTHKFLKNKPHISADFSTLSLIVNDVFSFYKITLEFEEVRNIQHIEEDLDINYFDYFD